MFITHILRLDKNIISGKNLFMHIYEQFVKTNTVEIIPLGVNIKYIIV